MDVYGVILLTFAALFVATAVVVFYRLWRDSTRGTLLAVAACLYVSSFFILPLGTMRGIALLGDLLKLTGVIGGILGIVDLIRVRKPPSPKWPT
jgi:hypothetical protein